MTMSSTQFLLFIVACIAISSPLKMRVPRPKTVKDGQPTDNLKFQLTECPDSKVEAGPGDLVPRDVSALQGAEAAD